MGWGFEGNAAVIKRLVLGLFVIVMLTTVGLGLSAQQSLPPVPAMSVSEGARLPLPSLSELVGSAQTDAEAYDLIRNYYTANHDALAVVFNEADETRLRALFGMYITHLAVPYNVVEVLPVTLLQFVSAETAHCGTYSLAQSQIYDALDVSWRNIIVDDGWHGIIEVLVGRQYETFDATSNVWVNLSIGEMIKGMTYTVMDEPRRYREFYTPVLDLATDDRYRVHLTDERCDRCSVPELRVGFSQWGLRVFPSRWYVAHLSADT